MRNISSNLTWSKQIVNLLYQKGVRYACISPGARNSPLIYQFINHSKIGSYSHIDERSCCFFGLGIAKKTKTPVVILTTSGTAIANLFPAIIESYMSMIPLIIITADRPKYLLNTGENQTINQKNIYGDYARASLDIGHKRSIGTLKKIDKILNTKKPPGPIHFNIRLDEPLIDKEDKIVPYIPKKSKNKIKKLSITLPLFKRPIIICGGLSKNDSNKILALAEKLNCPIFADILSNMRHIKSNRIKLQELEIQQKEIIIKYKKNFYYFKKTRNRYYYQELINIIKKYKLTKKEILKKNNTIKELKEKIIKLKNERERLEKKNMK